MNRKLKIGITHGDINGINYEIILKAFADSRITDLFTPIIYGSSKVASYYKSMFKNIDGFTFNIIEKAGDSNFKKINLINCIDAENPTVEPGVSTVEAGQYSVAALSRALADYNAGEIDAVVTCPINKANVQSDKFDFVGHTEYFASNFENMPPLMFMINEQIRVGLVTIHEPLSAVSSKITTEAILEKLRLIKQSLVSDFSINEPKIAVLGLNPHTGDSGLLGNEEQDIIIPALKLARKEGIYAFGPFAADGFFGSETYKKYDATLAMYHDQGLVPFKLISELGGVNYTAGLPIVRTSPSHGVGYDIAGKGEADCTSLREAIYAAIDICKSREVYRAISANPLQTYSRDNWGNDASVSDIPDGESKY